MMTRKMKARKSNSNCICCNNQETFDTLAEYKAHCKKEELVKSKPLPSTILKSKDIKRASKRIRDMIDKDVPAPDTFDEREEGSKAEVIPFKAQRTSPQQDANTSSKLDATDPVSNCKPKGKGKKEYSCPVPNCLKAFSNHPWYKNHLEMHEGLKSFVCPYCEYGYFDEIKLIEHVTAKHTKDPTFECAECKRSYQTKRTLEVHVNKFH